jgi:hypothetical protein
MRLYRTRHLAEAAIFKLKSERATGPVAGVGPSVLNGLSGATLIVPLSYQSIVTLAQSVSERPNEWNDLGTWVDRKIKTVAAQPISDALR